MLVEARLGCGLEIDFEVEGVAFDVVLLHKGHKGEDEGPSYVEIVVVDLKFAKFVLLMRGWRGPGIHVHLCREGIDDLLVDDLNIELDLLELRVSLELLLFLREFDLLKQLRLFELRED